MEDCLPNTTLNCQTKEKYDSAMLSHWNFRVVYWTFTIPWLYLSGLGYVTITPKSQYLINRKLISCLQYAIKKTLVIIPRLIKTSSWLMLPWSPQQWKRTMVNYTLAFNVSVHCDISLLSKQVKWSCLSLKRTKKWNPTMCQENGNPDIFGKWQ